jgi:hypothetical protein
MESLTPKPGIREQYRPTTDVGSVMPTTDRWRSRPNTRRLFTAIRGGLTIGLDFASDALTCEIDLLTELRHRGKLYLCTSRAWSPAATYTRRCDRRAQFCTCVQTSKVSR